MSQPGAPPPPRTASSGGLSDGQKDQLAVQALGLLNEQIQARIIHYRGDLETNSELDAITAQVVAQLKAMQAAAVGEAEGRSSPEEIEGQQIRTMTSLLSRVFKPQSTFVVQSLKPIGKRIAKLFFESELHEKTKGDKERAIHHAEQGVYYVLQRYKNRIRAELEGFDYDPPEARAATLELLAKIERDLQVAFLSRRSPELNRVMQIYTGVLTDFLTGHLPSRLEQMSRVAIRAAATAKQPNSVGYKIQADCFPRIRSEWERVFMQLMVYFCEDELMVRLSNEGTELRDETIRFFIDPHIFAETARVLCDSLYDYLCLEGFLDLPMDWRVTLASGS